MVLLLGPYHHNLGQRFLQVEEFKNEILINTIDPSTKGLFYAEILKHVDEIRIFYGGLSIDEYKDEALAEMMACDACFLLYYMESKIHDEKYAHIIGRLGLSTVEFLYQDVMFLENQIPLWVLKLLMTLKFDDKDAGEALFFRLNVFGDHQKMTRLPWAGKEHEPLHLLEAFRATLTVKEETGSTVEHRKRVHELISWRRKRFNLHGTTFELLNSPFRSVTYLRAKGIYCGPSSYCLKDIRFDSYAFYGKLLLPIWFVGNYSKMFFFNIMAFEISPETYRDFGVLAYVNFMKSLLKSFKDVKKLRERGILFSNLRNDEEVLKVFKEIDSYGMDNDGIFRDVKMRITEHCDSKAKTWIAKLIHSDFRSP